MNGIEYRTYIVCKKYTPPQRNYIWGRIVQNYFENYFHTRGLYAKGTLRRNYQRMYLHPPGGTFEVQYFPRKPPLKTSSIFFGEAFSEEVSFHQEHESHLKKTDNYFFVLSTIDI